VGILDHLYIITPDYPEKNIHQPYFDIENIIEPNVSGKNKCEILIRTYYEFALDGRESFRLQAIGKKQIRDSSLMSYSRPNQFCKQVNFALK
jgi:hypothetical protein